MLMVGIVPNRGARLEPEHILGVDESVTPTAAYPINLPKYHAEIFLTA